MKKKITSLIALLLIIILGTIVVVAASTPGSEDDPVVTKSYVDTVISKLESSLEGSGGSNAYKVLQLNAGQKLICGASTELILRSGEATAISITTNGVENGISDLTSGTDLTMGKAVESNHSVLVPRDDGRGITAGTDIYIMVRGEYSIE